MNGIGSKLTFGTLRSSSTKLGRSGIPASLQTNLGRESQELSSQAELPPDDDVAALLHKLRPFILQKEPTYFMTVCSILGKHLNNAYIRGFLKQTRHLFDGRQLQSKFRITVNAEALLNSDAVLDFWLNAHEYHKDREKQKKLEELTHMPTLDSAKVVFFILLNEKMRAIYATASLVASVLGKESKVIGYHAFVSQARMKLHHLPNLLRSKRIVR